MLLNVNEATTMACPLAFASSTSKQCVAAECPVWRWAEEKTLETYTGLKEISDSINNDYNNAMPSDKQIMKRNPPLWDNFEKPKGQGWTRDGDASIRERLSKERPWHQRWVREEDPDRRGFCGLGGKPGF